MAWQNRLLDTIELTSPEGAEFIGLFRASTTTNSKKLGIFSYPGVNGEIVQDLGINSDRDTFSVIFDGPNHDITKKEFEKALKETGRWLINHPVNGVVSLQLIDYSFSDDPIDNGNNTTFDLNWIEPIPDSEIISISEQRNIIERLTDAVNNSAAVAFVNNVSQVLASATQAIKDVTDDIVALRDSVLGPIAKLNNEIFNLGNSIQRGINLTLADTVVDVQSLAGQIQQLIETPGLIITSVENQVDAFDGMINGTTTLSPENPTIEGKNVSQSQELTFLAALNGLCLGIINGEILTRSQAISAAESLILLFDTLTNNLDGSQTLFENQDIDKQYFSQSESYTDATQLVSVTLNFLISSLFNLKIEKRFILDTPKMPVQIVIEEFGSLGDNDETLDFFIETNNLKANDIILLPAGHEVVVYV